VGVKVSDSKTITATDESDLFSVPDPYVAYLRRLAVTNRGASLATFTFKAYNGDASKTVLVVNAAANETIVLAEDELPEEGIPTKLTATGTAQPYDVSYTYELE
jgi:hypothetical protein